MNDFLSHLATRAVATVPTLRPLVPSLYEPVTERLSETIEREPSGADKGLRNSIRAANPAWRTRRPATAAESSAEVDQQRDEKAAPANADTSRSLAAVVSSAAPFTLDGSSETPSLSSDVAPIASEIAGDAPRPSAANTRDVHSHPGENNPAPARNVLPAPASHAAATSGHAATLRDSPVSLRPGPGDARRRDVRGPSGPATAQVRDEIARRPQPPGPLAPAAMPALAELPPLERAAATLAIAPPQINVTIGRVEIRAVTPAGRPGPAQHNSAPRLSLDAYLDGKPANGR